LLFLEHSAALPDEEEDPTKDFRNRNPGPGPRNNNNNNNENNPAPRKGKVKTDGNIVEKTSEEKTFRNILLLFMNVWD